MSATKTTKTPRINLVSPKAPCVWPKLDKPDTKFNPEGTYSIKLILSPNEDAAHAEFVSKIEAFLPDATEHLKAELDRAIEAAPGAKKAPLRKALEALSVRSPLAPVYDDDGNETGELSLTAKMKAVVKKKDGTMRKQRPAVQSASGQPLNPAGLKMGSGSIVRVAISLAPYRVPSSNDAGLSVYLDAVRVIKLVEYGDRSAAFGDAEEGDDLSDRTGSGGDDDAFGPGEDTEGGEDGDF